MKYVFMRGKSVWCRYPLPGKPRAYPLGIKMINDSQKEKERCLKLGELELSKLRVKALHGEEIGKFKINNYNPTYRRLCQRYYVNQLGRQQSGKTEKYHLKVSYNYFGSRKAKEITKDEINKWLDKQLAKGFSINTVNNQLAYMKAVYNWAENEDKEMYRINYNPCKNVARKKGGATRTFVLTREQFELNYLFFLNGKRTNSESDLSNSDYEFNPRPDFALFYLALWETMRRPNEVAQYTWEMVNEMIIDGKTHHCFNVPPIITKTKEYDIVYISNRLYNEMLKNSPKKSGLVFTNSHGAKWKHWHIFRLNLLEVFGEKGGWIRDCRRGSITNKVEIEGFDPMHVRMQSGHKSNSIFERYRIGKLTNVVNMFPSSNNNEKNDKSSQSIA